MTERGGAGGTIGERLKRARKAVQPPLTLDELARRIDAEGGRRTIIRWEADEHLPKPVYRQRLIRELSLPGDFFDGLDPPEEARLSRRVAALERAVARIERRLFEEGAVRGR